MTDWAGAIYRGIEALDFLPVGLNAKPARPPDDADGRIAMFAAIKFHDMLPGIASKDPYTAARAAWGIHRQFTGLEGVGASRDDLAPVVRLYREALTLALREYAAGDEPAKLDELVRWYRQDLKE